MYADIVKRQESLNMGLKQAVLPSTTQIESVGICMSGLMSLQLDNWEVG